MAFCFKIFSYTNNLTKVISRMLFLQWKLSRLSVYSRCQCTAGGGEFFFQRMEPPLRKNTKHTSEIFLGKCPMMVSSFITVIAYLSVTFVSSLVHTSSFAITAACIAFFKSLIKPTNTLHFLFTTASHLNKPHNKLQNTFTLQFQFMHTTHKIIFV